MTPLKVVVAMLCLGATTSCQAAAPLPADPNGRFDPVAFFTGSAEGEASLKVIASAAKPVRVHSEGRSDSHGGVILIQRIAEGTKPPRTRTWTMRPVAPGRFTGTLVPDAQGPVAISVTGPRASIAYRMTNGMRVTQDLALQADGRTLLNRLVVHKFGMAVAELNETIRKTR